MSRNIFDVPRDLWAKDLPPGWECTLYVGRMVGQLQQMSVNKNFAEFAFEMHDPEDATEMVLLYNTLEAPARELARWETAGDLVGLVMAHKGQRMYMVMAYNFSRRKVFGTGYYPHVMDKRPFSTMSIKDSHNMAMLSVALICTCIVLLLLPIALYANATKSKQYQILNPTDYRREAVEKIAVWIKANEARFASGGDSDADISL